MAGVDLTNVAEKELKDESEDGETVPQFGRIDTPPSQESQQRKLTTRRTSSPKAVRRGQIGCPINRKRCTKEQQQWLRSFN